VAAWLVFRGHHPGRLLPANFCEQQRSAIRKNLEQRRSG